MISRYRIWRAIEISTIFGLFLYQSSKRNSDSFLCAIVNCIQNCGSSKIIGDVIGILVAAYGLRLVGDVWFTVKNYKSVQAELTDLMIDLVIFLPASSSVLDIEKSKLEDGMDSEIKRKSRECISSCFKRLPDTGISAAKIKSLLSTLVYENISWKNGKASGQVYHGGQEHQNLLNDVFAQYSLSNPLHPETWPSVMKFESEVIAMTASLMNGNGKISTVCGCTTSGGTESIILAIKAHRDYYCRGVLGVTSPEIVCCTSAHAAVDKAGDLMGIRIIKVPPSPITFRADVCAMERAITPRTIMLYGSAPSYAQGVMDPIAGLSNLALSYGLGLHVDCCLGGFILPFARQLGYDIADFDFTLPGVSSMSVDTHKYGYALKGTSVVLYRDPKMRHAQYFCYPKWTGGLYTTPTIAGSRSGGLIAQCWASMITMGREGYLECARDILNCARVIAKGISSIPGLQVLGSTDAMVVCFGVNSHSFPINKDRLVANNSNDGSINPSQRNDMSSSSSENRQGNDTTKEVTEFVIYSVIDRMAQKGWSLNTLQFPPCAHICVTLCHVGKEDILLSDLKLAVEEVAETAINMKSGSAAIYGMTAALPGGPIKELLKTYNDVVLKL